MGRKIACLLGCPDENDPARLCIAYDGDELAPCDVRSMRDALGRHGFESCIVPPNLERRGQIADHLTDIARTCTAQDEFLFYFTGHGRYRNGVLEFSLGPKEALPASDLLRVMTNDCRAATKLAILDCCFAGAIEADLIKALEWPRQCVDARLLLAATEGQRALHDPMQGSYFTRFLCEALTDAALWERIRRSGFVDVQGNIDSDGLVAWLRNRTETVAQDNGLRPAQIPRPLALPQDSQGFRVLRLELDQPLGYPDYLQRSLREAIPASAISADAPAVSYAWCIARQSAAALPDLETLNGVTAIVDALLHPKAFFLDSDDLKLPLISFVAHLNPRRRRRIPQAAGRDHRHPASRAQRWPRRTH